MTSDAATESLEQWVHHLPSSRMVHPHSIADWPKYLFWRLYTPLHPWARDLAESFGVTSASFVRHQRAGRQEYLLGTIAPDQSLREFITYLIDRGFGNHFIAWRDDGQVASLRHVENFVHQYHLRIFDDGEVRGHYEYTPECRPIKHLHGIGQEDRRAYFLKLLGDRIIPKREE